MAAASPAPNNVTADTSHTTAPSTISTTTTTTTTTTIAVAASPALSPSTSAATVNPTNQNTPSNAKPTGLPTITLQRTDQPKTLRGLNKPKCIKCGNVARSRCPYQSCKSCCSKAQNPCHIHVLKPNSTLADKSPANSTTPEQHTNDAPTSGPLHKASSIRQLSSNFAQFNNLQVPRSRKPLTRKEAIAVNEWRFSKLKEFRERNIEAENEAFDRYMQNIKYLEEVFDGYSEGNTEDDGSLGSETCTTVGDEMEMLPRLKARLRCNPVRMDRLRKRIQNTVDQGLMKLQKTDSRDCDKAMDEEAAEPAQTLKVDRSCQPSRKTMALNELNDKVNKARNEEDLKFCMQMMSQIRSQEEAERETEGESDEKLKDQAAEDENLTSEAESDSPVLKLVRMVKINHDTLKSMDSHFVSLEEIEDL